MEEGKENERERDRHVAFLCNLSFSLIIYRLLLEYNGRIFLKYVDTYIYICVRTHVHSLNGLFNYLREEKHEGSQMFSEAHNFNSLSNNRLCQQCIQPLNIHRSPIDFRERHYAKTDWSHHRPRGAHSRLNVLD